MKKQQQQLKEDAFYQAKNLSGRDAKILAQLSTDNISAISKTVAAVQDLIKNLDIYKECLVDSINLEAEAADLASKYSMGDEARFNGVYNLPGVISTPKSYDIDAIKNDSARMAEIQNERQKVASQKETYIRLCKEDVNVFIEAWKALNYQNAYWNEFITTLNNNINQNY